MVFQSFLFLFLFSNGLDFCSGDANKVFISQCHKPSARDFFSLLLHLCIYTTTTT